MIAHIRRCLAFLPARLRWRWAAQLPLALVAAGLETVGAAAVFFLIKVVSDPSRIAELPLPPAVAARLASIGGALAVPWLTLAVALFYVGKNILLAVLVYLQRRLMGESQVALSRRMMRGYLTLPYAVHLRRNSAELVRNVSESAFRVFDRVLGPALAMLTEALVIVGIVAVLIWTAPWPTVFAVAVLFACASAQHRALLPADRFSAARTRRGRRRLRSPPQKQSGISRHDRAYEAEEAAGPLAVGPS